MKLILALLTSVQLFISCKDKYPSAVNKELAANVEMVKSDEKGKEEDKQYAGFLPDSTGTPQTKDPEKNNQPAKPVLSPNPDWDKKIIKSASLNIEIKEEPVDG